MNISTHNQTYYIPYDYVVEYVGNNSTNAQDPTKGYGIEYVDLNFAFPEEFTLFIDMDRISNPSYTTPDLFGNADMSGGLSYCTSYGAAYMLIGNQEFQVCHDVVFRGRQTISISVTSANQTVSVSYANGKSYSTQLKCNYTPSNSHVLLFSREGRSTSNSKCCANIYSCWIKDKFDNYILNLVPCVKDNVAYFFDTVSRKMLGNSASSGNLVAPPRQLRREFEA